MGNRFQQLFLALFVVFSYFQSNVAYAAEEESEAIQVIGSDVKPMEVKQAKIDTEYFELGGFAGLITIDGAGSEFLYGVSGSFHATEDYFLQFNFGATEIGRTFAEDLLNSNMLTDRDYLFYNLSVGYNLFPGETFFSKNRTYNSTFYVVAGAGNTNFDGSDNFTVVLGTGYRVVLSDYMTLNLDYRDQIFSSSAYGSSEKERLHNFSFTTGLTFFF